MKQDLQDKIDNYILGRMSEEEKTQMEAEMNQDKSLKEEVEFTRNVKHAISSREEKLAKMKVMEQQYEQEQRLKAIIYGAISGSTSYNARTSYDEPASKPSRKLWWWASGIAAIVAVVLMIANPFKSDTIPVETYPEEIFRGGEDEIFDHTEVCDSVAADSIPQDTTLINE